MTTFVLGAGASYPVYPLASRLLEKVSEFITQNSSFIDRFNYAEWPEIMEWIAKNPNPLLRQAYRTATSSKFSRSWIWRTHYMMKAK
jgi:hypothetical protein